MPIIYNGQTFPLLYNQIVIDKLEEIVSSNILYGLYVNSLDHAIERNDNLFNDIIEANRAVFQNSPYAYMNDGTLIFRLKVESIRYSGNSEFKDGTPTGKKIKYGGSLRAKNLQYYIFALFDGKKFVASELFGVTQNWKDGYLKEKLKATINESYKMYNYKATLLSTYIERSRRTVSHYFGV